MSQASDIKIARAAQIRPIGQIASAVGITEDELSQYGKHKAKISLDLLERLSATPDGKLILVTAMTPTPAGEGKTTVTVSVGDGLNRLGKKTVICLREPSLGPCFGMKGGAAGGGYAQVIPMEDINLHFTGDFHAIGLAHNLLSATIDNHLHHGNDLQIDSRRITWRRVMDMNDRALRDNLIGLGGPTNGMPRESGFDITAASEIMAVLCLAENIQDLKHSLANIIVAQNLKKEYVRARDLNVHGAMTVLLREALQPNLVQTLEGNPAIIHGGPFANIAHGCNSVLATKMGLKLADFVVTEAGFGSDLGAEKFFNIKCRKSGLYPHLAVLVATIRSLKMQGKVAFADLAEENPDAVRKGFRNLKRHIHNLKAFNVPVVVSLNHFTEDRASEIQVFEELMRELDSPFAINKAWAEGSAGSQPLAELVAESMPEKAATPAFTYPEDLGLWDKIRRIAQEIYGADDIEGDMRLRNHIRRLEEDYGSLPICMAKTQYSFSTDAKLVGAPKKFNVPLREVRLAAGAQFLVVITGNIMTMPGLPKTPSAEVMDIDENGEIVGLF